MLPLVVLLLAAKLDSTLAAMNLPEETQQAVLVETQSWTSTAGQLQMLSKVAQGWVTVGPKIPVSVGRTGLAWGRGLQIEVGEGPQKTEGDGKAPAGVFSLGSAVVGLHDFHR